MPTHRSILFINGEDSLVEAGQPDFFADLNLDQVVAAATLGLEEFRLPPVFYSPLRSVDAVAYRQEVARDLEDAELYAMITAFADSMSLMRSHAALSAKSTHAFQGPRSFLEAASIYVDAVLALTRDLAGAGIASRGLAGVREDLADYTASERFGTLRRDVRAVLDDLGRIRFHMAVDGGSVRVSEPAGEPDYAAEVIASFDRFRQSEVRAEDEPSDDGDEEPPGKQMGAFSTRVLNLVARLYPKVFASLRAFAETHREFLAPADLDRELRFYTSYLTVIAPLRAAGLPFTFPTMSGKSKLVDIVGAFDLPLALKLTLDGSQTVRNDVRLGRGERILVVTGPNQGGKTTYARMFGQVHYLASLGLPVPGKTARLFLFDTIFTHFDREESLADGAGKLEDELVRIRAVLERATPRSIVILNEMFTSTTVDDATFIGTYVLRRIVELGALCVCVTFIDAFASLSPSTVSMMSTVDDADATRRTFWIVRKPADGLAYAAAIAAKHRLEYSTIKGRLAS
jgi:hypothetical protein